MKYLKPQTTTLASALILACSAMGSAHAENRLFPTDMLERGEADVQLSISAMESKADQVDLTSNQKLQYSSRTAGQKFYAHVGIGEDWSVGAGVDYQSRDDSRVGPQSLRKTTGITATRVNVAKRFLDGKTDAMALTVGLDLMFTPADLGSSLTTASLSAQTSWNSSSSVKPVVGLIFDAANKGSTPRRLSATLGTSIRVNDQFTLYPHTVIARQLRSVDRPSYNSFDARLEAWLGLTGNTYLTSSLGVLRTESLDDRAGNYHAIAPRSSYISVGVYHLF